MTDHEIIVAMAKAMAKADGVPVESMPPSMTWGGVDYLGTARRQFHGGRAATRCENEHHVISQIKPPTPAVSMAALEARTKKGKGK